jgi:GPI ethanolamine phosphate transferase 3 subunit O
MASRLPPPPKLTAEALNAATGSSNASQRPNLTKKNSHGSHSSDGSHSSHSSHQERQRQQHLGEGPGGPPSVIKPIASAVAILFILFIGQAVGLWLFTKGFLLTRTTLEGVSSCDRPAQSSFVLPSQLGRVVPTSDAEFQLWQDTLIEEAECTLPAKYDQTFLWIIDALRFDFLADTKLRDTSNNHTWSPNPYYHDILNLPAKLNKEQKSFSFLSHFLADAPTTTLQRLKGLTTGSLPTFIDAGSNFGGSEITEDNWLSQMRKKAESIQGQSAKMGIAGDDTWLTVFPTLFDQEWRFPFDSFNVEDLDGVDRGVEQTLNPFLNRAEKSLTDWRLLIAHTLGVDHVGHRLGASHPRMRSKLEEMQQFLEFIIGSLPENALFILMGDHGMDEKGDHGGDGELEVGAALWMYSKRKHSKKLSESDIRKINSRSEELIKSYQQFSLLPSPPFDASGHRSIPQIDIVPTLSLLLEQPIPFNNLGSVIPEAFESSALLLRALRINALQIRKYFDEYAKVSSDFQPFKDDLRSAWYDALRKDAQLANAARDQKETLELETAQAYLYFNRLALVKARSVWAKFEIVKMVIGLSMLVLSFLTLIRIKSVSANEEVEVVLREIVKKSNPGILIGAIIGFGGKIFSLYAFPLLMFQTLELWESVLAGLVFGSQISLLLSLTKLSRTDQSSIPSDWSFLGALLPVLHSIAFSSNSFTVQEDKVVLALAIVVLLYRGIQGYLNSPTTRLKIRTPILAIASAIAIRIASTSRVCREEQAPQCTTTFYSQTDSTLNSPIVILAAYGLALAMPTLLQQALHVSRSDGGVAPLFFTWMLRPALLAGAGYWFVDWLVTADVLGTVSENEGTSSNTISIMEMAKLALARADFALIVVIALAFWIFSPLCLEMKQEVVPASEANSGVSTGNKSATRIIVLGFANSFGSSYLILLSLVFALHFLVAQPMGQVALSLIVLVIVACAELGDHERDGEIIQEIQKSQQMMKQVATPKGRQTIQPQQATPAPRTALPVTMLEVSTLALVGFVAFFATGHQTTFASIQWRTAFVGFRSVQYPFSPFLVILNSFGPLALLPSLALPLLIFWNLAPQPRSNTTKTEQSTMKERRKDDDDQIQSNIQRMPTIQHILQASLSFIFYHLIITLSSAIFAAHFRRHLMLFKIWTPRFMTGAISLQIVFFGLIIGIIAAGNVMNKVTVTFGSQF